MRKIDHSRDIYHIECDMCRARIDPGKPTYQISLNSYEFKTAVGKERYQSHFAWIEKRDYCSIYCAMQARQYYIKIVRSDDPFKEYGNTPTH